MCERKNKLKKILKPKSWVLLGKSAHLRLCALWSTSRGSIALSWQLAAVARSYPRCFNARFTNQIVNGGCETEQKRTRTTRRSVTSRFGRSTTCPRDRKRGAIAGCVAGHLRALLTLDFLSQLKARSRDGGGACRSHVEHVRQNRFERRAYKTKEDTLNKRRSIP